MDWPNDADGDVFRGLAEEGYDFSEVSEIDFNIDFEEWPLTQEALAVLAESYPDFEVIEPDDEDIENGALIGYVQFHIVDQLSYELVVNTQASVTKKMQPFGGYCDSWGVVC